MPNYTVHIVGHTDNTSDAINHSLSLNRANATRSYLINLGPMARASTPKAKACVCPIANNASAQGARNPPGGNLHGRGCTPLHPATRHKNQSCLRTLRHDFKAFMP